MQKQPKQKLIWSEAELSRLGKQYWYEFKSETIHKRILTIWHTLLSILKPKYLPTFMQL